MDAPEELGRMIEVWWHGK